MANPQITVLMAVYNSEPFLNSAIDSILSQKFTDFEFLIIDDCSSDRSMEIINSYHDSRIRVLSNEKNIGLTKSLNRGLNLAKGEYIARMDSDDISYPERLEHEIMYMKQNPDVAIVGTWAETIDIKGTRTGQIVLLKKPDYKDFLHGNQCVHGSILVRREILYNHGGYDDRFRQCQDFALFLSLVQKYQIRNLPEVLYSLRIHRTSVSAHNWNNLIFYHILAIRLSKGESIKETLEKGPDAFFKDFQNLRKDERVFYHTTLANNYRILKKLKGARKEYFEIIKSDPLNIFGYCNYFRTFFGEKCTNISTRIYQIIQGIFRK